MAQEDKVKMHRSTSMPVKPRLIEPKALKRSEEKEKIYDSSDYYPESPIVERRKKTDFGSQKSKSANYVPDTSDWVGSTIELNLDSRYSDPMCSNRRHHRVIGKSGHENVSFRRIPQKSWRYVRDLVTTMVSALTHFIQKKCLTSTSSNRKINNENIITPIPTKLSIEQLDLESFADDDDNSEHTNQNNTKGKFYLGIKP